MGYSSSRQSQTRNQKVAVFHQVLCRLREMNDVEEAAEPGFEDELWAYFSMLPLCYALDVDTEQAKDVLIHKKLLNMARDPLAQPAVLVRLLQACPNLGNTVQPNRPFHEIFIATKDKPKILTAVTGLMLSEIGLIIQEAHVFCTTDGYSFFAFVVDGWEKGIDHLRSTLVKEIPNILATKEISNV